MKIYRVERHDGEGPFSGRFIDHMNTSLPEPRYDPGFPEDFYVNRAFIFGCRNKRLMRQWITDARELAKVGFVVNEYTVDKKRVLNGRYQSLFSYEDATLVKKHSIVSFKHG